MKRIPIILTAPIAASVLLAGCSSGTQTGAAPATPATSAPAAESAGTNPSPTPSSTGTKTATSTGSTTSPGTTRCHSGDLSLKLGSGGGAAGTQYENLVFTNKANHTCTLYGYPGVSWVTGDNGTQVNDPFERNSTTAKKTIKLAPGAHAHAVLATHAAELFDKTKCKPESVRGLRIYPPDETASIFVSQPGTACSAKGVNLGSVQAIASGVGDEG
jgi:hypothetical protein